MWGGRSGREPVRATSPLRLRLAISLFGAIVCAAAAVALFVLGWVDVWTWILALGAVIAIVDALVILRRMSTSDRASSSITSPAEALTCTSAASQQEVTV